MLTSRTKRTSSHDHPRDHQPEVADAAAELGLRRPRRQALGDRAEGGVASGADDDRGADPASGRRCPRKTLLLASADAVRPRRKIDRRIFSTGSDSPVSADSRTCRSFDVEQAGVGRHQVSGVQLDDVAGDQLRDRQLLLPPVAQDGGGRRDLLADRLHRVARLELHEEVQQHAEQDHRDDDQAADRVAQRDRDDAGHQENDDERIGEEAEEVEQRREARLPDEAVRTVETKSPLRLVGRQAGRRSPAAARAAPAAAGPRSPPAAFRESPSALGPSFSHPSRPPEHRRGQSSSARRFQYSQLRSYGSGPSTTSGLDCRSAGSRYVTVPPSAMAAACILAFESR